MLMDTNRLFGVRMAVLALHTTLIGNMEIDMQLKLEREEQKRGLLRKKTFYLVTTQLLCSEEERQAIKTLGLDTKTFVEEYECDGLPQGRYEIGYWADKGAYCTCYDIPHAQKVEQEITESAKTVKAHVESFLESGSETEPSNLIDL